MLALRNKTRDLLRTLMINPYLSVPITPRFVALKQQRFFSNNKSMRTSPKLRTQETTPQTQAKVYKTKEANEIKDPTTLTYRHIWAITLKFISEDLEFLTSLKKLELKFDSEWDPEKTPGVNITDGDLDTLGESFKNQTSLEHLKLRFNGQMEITDQGILSLTQGFKYLTSLKSLEVDLDWCASLMTDETIMHLSESFQQLSSLENLTVLVSANKMTDRAIEALSKGLTCLTSLKSLHLGFYDCFKFTDRAMMHLGQTFEQITSLKSVDLHFSHSKYMTDNGIAQLAKGLGYLTSLQNLSFQLSGLKEMKITDIGIKGLSEQLRNVNTLDTMHLQFWDLDLSDDAIKSLSEDLRNLKSLKKITLDLWGAKRITDDSVRFISELLQHLPSLETIILNFWQLEIKGTELKSLSEGLAHLTSLKGVEIGLTCQNISQDAKNSLKKQLRANIPSLEKIKVY